MKPMTVYLVAMFLCTLAATGSLGATWQVELNGTGDFTDIQPAVDAAATGDTILIGPGRFDTFHPVVAPAWTEETIVWVTKDYLTFIGSGQDVTIIGPTSYYGAPGENPKGFTQFPGMTGAIRDLTIDNIEVGVYWFEGTLNLEGCRIKAHTSEAVGLAIWPSGGSVRNCKFEMNNGGRGVAVATAGVDLTIEDCQFAGPGYAVAAVGGSRNTQINRCEIREPRWGISFDQSATGLVSDCSIYDASDYSILISGGSRVTMDGTSIYGAATGISIDAGATLVGNRVIVEGSTREALLICCNALVTLNTSHILPALGWAIRGDGVWRDIHSLDLTGNYWGTSDAAAIAALIWDGLDDPAIQCAMQFEPFADGPVPTESTSWGSVKSMFR